MPVAGWKENHVLAAQQRSISLSAGRCGLQGKAGALRPSLALSVSSDGCLVPEANGAALLLRSNSRRARLDFQSPSEHIVCWLQRRRGGGGCPVAVLEALG